MSSGTGDGIAQVPVMHVPGYGLWPVMQVFGPHEELPCEDARYLVVKDGTAYRVPMDAKELKEQSK